MSSSGYLTLSFFSFNQIDNNVRVPTLPINIVIQIIILEITDNLWVIPVVNPTVQKALVTSNNISFNSKFLLNKHIKNELKNIITKTENNITKLLLIIVLVIVLLWLSQFLFVYILIVPLNKA